MNTQKTLSPEESIMRMLRIARIDVNQWGKGSAKTINHLIQEVLTGECVLRMLPDGTLIRTVHAVGAEIFHETENAIYKLIEGRQEFCDGRIRVRMRQSSVSEKMLPGENPRVAMRRGVQEELGIFEAVDLLEKGIICKLEDSGSYPGLLTRSIRHKFQIIFPDRLYNPNGYIEVQPDKTTYFVWRQEAS